MLEYHEKLSRLPIWYKTKYYCQNPSIYSCKTNKKVGISAVITTKPDKLHDIASKDLLSVSQNKSFQLGNYEINEKSDESTRWKTFAGYSGIKGGNCFMAEDILFIEPGEIEDAICLKKDFLRHLKQFPQWDKTHFFCPHVALYPCITETGNRKMYHTNYSNIASTSNRNESKQMTSIKQNFIAMDDQQQRMNSVLRWSTSIMYLIFSLVEFLINFFIELIGIKKK